MTLHMFIPVCEIGIKCICIKIPNTQRKSTLFCECSPCFTEDLILPQHIHPFLTHSHTMTPFDACGKQACRKHCGKWRNCS